MGTDDKFLDPVCICIAGEPLNPECPLHKACFESRPAVVTSLGGTMYLPHIARDADFRTCLEACDKLLATKGADYTHGGRDRLVNFDEAAKFLGLSPFRVLGVYLYKHLTAIFTFFEHGKVESEPIEGRLQDAINYLLLAYKMAQRDRAAINVRGGKREGI